MPETRWADKFIGFLKFIRSHKRLPTNKLIFNDYLYKIKTTDEILNPVRVFVSDKEFVKLYVKAKVGDEYNVPTIGILRSLDEVDTFEFPERCCIKPTHSSGHYIIRKNNELVDTGKIKSWFSVNYYTKTREANYRNLTKKCRATSF